MRRQRNTSLCSVLDCGRTFYAHGWCNKHYMREYARDRLRFKYPSPLERFVAKVNFDGSIPDFNPSLGPCWLWTAGTRWGGYAYFKSAGKGWAAHRFIYEMLVGPIPEGLVIDHLCRVRACVNPDHMEPVTFLENLRRGFGPTMIQSQEDYCTSGHEYTPENTLWHKRYKSPLKTRKCRICYNANWRKGYWRRKTA